MHVAVLLLAASAPSVGEVLALPPMAAGERLLAGREHRAIVSLRIVPPQTMDPPGHRAIELVEAPAKVKGGCLRRRWTAGYSERPGESADAAVLNGVYPVEEVALAGRRGCRDYVHVNPGLDATRALSALATFSRIARGRARVRFDCRSEIARAPCGGPTQIRKEIASVAPWVVTGRDGWAEVWLRGPAAPVTRVRFDPERPTTVSVVREIPAPF